MSRNVFKFFIEKITFVFVQYSQKSKKINKYRLRKYLVNYFTACFIYYTNPAGSTQHISLQIRSGFDINVHSYVIQS